MTSIVKSRAGAVFCAVLIAAVLLLFYFHWTELTAGSALVGTISLLVCLLLIVMLALLWLRWANHRKQDSTPKRTQQ